MVTRDEIQEFAEMNNMYINTDRDIDYFVNLLNSNGGKCPCDEYRICPCQQAVSEAQRAVQEDKHKEACCICHLLVTKEYIDEWGIKLNTEQNNKPKQTKTESKWEIKTPMLIELLGTFKKAEKLMDGGEIGKAAETLTNKANESDCGMCQNMLSTERLRMDYVGRICEMDSDECEIEKMRARERTKRIEEFLKKVDEYAETGKIDGKEVQKEEENEQTVETQPKKQSEYHACLKTMPANMPNAGALPEKETRVRFAIASKMCAKQGRGEETTFEEELSNYREEHPEFFERNE